MIDSLLVADMTAPFKKGNIHKAMPGGNIAN